jgi:hypothetical protein
MGHWEKQHVRAAFMNRLLYWFRVFGITFAAFSNVHATAADANSISFTMRFDNKYFHYFNTNHGTGRFLVLSGAPSYEAVIVRYSPSEEFVPLSKEDIKNAVWTPYDGIIRMNFGPTDGVYDVELSLKGADSNAGASWVGTLVTVTRTIPEIVITNPTNNVVTQPYLQLQGRSKTELDSIKYDISNAERSATNLDGQTTGDDLDIQTGKYTAHYFQCYDILLTTGLNLIALHVTDKAGNIFTTNLNITLNYSMTTPPMIQLVWPKDGMDICGNSFTLRGQVQDASSLVSASITDSNGHTTTIHGEVERDGKLWAENLPLHDGTNQVSLTVTNSAGLSSVTNISVVHSSFVLVMDSTKGSLWLPTTTVTGHESDATYPVWVNGVKAVVSVNSDGTGKWVAQNVPVTPSGVASFDMHAYAPNGIQPDGHYGNGTLVVAGKNFDGSTTTNNLASIKAPVLAATPSLVTSVQPFLINIAESNSTFYFTWNTVSNRTYQLQYTTNLTSSNWINLGVGITTISNSVSTTDTVGPDTHRFYRVQLLPSGN